MCALNANVARGPRPRVGEINPEASLSILEMGVFKGLSGEAVAAIKAKAKKVTFQPGETVHEYGEPVKCVFVLERGAVNILMPESRRQLYTVREPGSLLGWSSMVGRRTASATLECVEPATLLRLEKKDLEAVFKKYPACGQVFYRKLAQDIGERLTNAYRVISLLLGEIA
ncbi:MAG: cyclic nucleotide-binding domain-containing protein [Thermodesulfobacteriota bacterium]